ncbi:hypothetical protein MFFDBJGM_02492 [Pectobacterium versatile]|uniref:DUF2514 family protein n=1 Tax=Pectobacterium versatile TaxID=2488639 RepID=UPI000DAB3914|nr:DUF2514 family protein [Pectobacterium versatile]GBO49474.1 hypothetical protein MFFDBJGM_02492 [Pectobacterium versatile]
MSIMIGELLKRNWKSLALITLVAFLMWGFSHWRYTAGQDDANATWQLKWAQRDTADTEALAKRQSYERQEERRRQEAINAISTNAQLEIEQAQADAVNAQSAAVGLQSAIGKLKRQLAASETGRISSVAAASAAKSEAAILLAELLSESDKAAGEYAAEADSAYRAGMTCERAYDAITG